MRSKSLAARTREAVRNEPFLHDALRAGVLNYTAVARYLEVDGEHDAIATALAALPLADARELAERWEGLEALVVHDGVFHATAGFDSHVLDA